MMHSLMFLFLSTAFARDANRMRTETTSHEDVLERKQLRSLANSLLSSSPAVRGHPRSKLPARRAGVEMKASRRDALAIALALATPPLAASAAAEMSFQKEFEVFADALIPIVRQLKASNVGPLAGKAVTAAVTGNPKEIVKTINAGLDVLLSIPPDSLFVAAKLLKEGTAEAAEAESCNLVCLPPKERTEQVARSIANAVSLSDPVKLRSFLQQAGVSFASGDPKAYAATSGDLLKFFIALDKTDFNTAKDAALAIVLAIQNMEVDPAKQLEAEVELPNKYTQNGKVEVVAEELADALYPIVKTVKAKDVGPFASKLVELGATGDPKEIIKTIDAGLAAFLSVSPDRFFAAVSALKEAVNEAVDAPSCNLICVAPKETVQKFTKEAATALSVANPDLLKTFVDQAIKSLETGDKKEYAIVAKEGKKFLKTLDPDDVQRVKAVTLDLLKATGSKLYTDINWGYSDL